jgi:hypothetical protein|tara:strand:- start:596 stop:1894 length:1299 start_codon:yes stop_codon:yes gene_type:complete
MSNEFNMGSTNQEVEPLTPVAENYTMNHITFEDVRGILSLVEIALTRGALKGDEIETVNAIRKDCVAEVNGYQNWVQARNQYLQDRQVRQEQKRLIDEQNLRELEKVEQEARISQQIMLRKEIQKELEELKAQVGLNVPQVTQEVPVPPVSKPSGAFKLARMLNPESEEITDNDYQPVPVLSMEDAHTFIDDEMDDTAESEGKDIYGGRITSSTAPIISGGNAPSVTFEGQEEIQFEEPLASSIQEAKTAFQEWDMDNAPKEDKITPIADGVYIRESHVEDEPIDVLPLVDSVPYEHRMPVPNTDALLDMPNVTEEGSTLDIGYEQPVVGEDDIVLKASDIKIFDEQPAEEEYDEVVIPSASELQSMTKSRIQDAASKLEFTGITGTKASMIKEFTAQSEQLIADLTSQEGFVDASETVIDSNDERRDGGYF